MALKRQGCEVTDERVNTQRLKSLHVLKEGDSQSLQGCILRTKEAVLKLKTSNCFQVEVVFHEDFFSSQLATITGS